MSPPTAHPTEAALPARPAAVPLPPVAPRRPPPRQVADPLYPSSDGRPMAENTRQLRVMVDGISCLRTRYRHRLDAFVGGDLLMYYERGNPARRVAPDVFVIFGVPDHDRMSYKLWEEGKVPDFVLEVASESTWREDVGRKRRLYAGLGVQEYWLFDPQAEFLSPPLQGLALRNGEYVELPERTESGVRVLHSRVLGLDLRAEGGALRFRDPATGEDLRTLEEETAARQQMEAANRSAQARNAELEARVRALEAQLAAERKRGASGPNP